jgi:hypothetical protein
MIAPNRHIMICLLATLVTCASMVGEAQEQDGGPPSGTGRLMFRDEDGKEVELDGIRVTRVAFGVKGQQALHVPLTDIGPDDDLIVLTDGGIEAHRVREIDETHVHTGDKKIPRRTVIQVIFAPVTRTSWVLPAELQQDAVRLSDGSTRAGRIGSMILPSTGQAERKSGAEGGGLRTLSPETLAEWGGGEPVGECRAARDTAMKLLDQIDQDVTDEVRSAAAEHVSGRELAMPEAKAWSNLATGYLLGGDDRLAAWAALSALKLDWSGLNLTNAGVALLHHNERRAALMLLRCAFRLGYRSAYWFEAMAAAELAGGKRARARRHIEAAARLAPDDIAIAAEAELLGVEPRPTPDEGDVNKHIGVASREFRKHARQVMEALETWAAELDAYEAAAGFPRDRYREKWLAQRREEYRAYIRFLKDHFYFSDDERMRKNRLHFHNIFMLGCVMHYLRMTAAFLDAPDQMHADWWFWAEATGKSPTAYISKLKKEVRRFDKPVKRHFKEPLAELTSYDPGFSELCMLLNSDRGDWIEGEHRAEQKVARLPRQTPEPKLKRARLEYCRTCRELLSAYKAATQRKMPPRLRNTDRVAHRWLFVAETYMYDAHDYATRTMKYLWTDEKGKPPKVVTPDGKQIASDAEERMIETINGFYSENMTWGMRYFVDVQLYRAETNKNIHDLLLESAHSIFNDGPCSPIELEKLGTELTKEEYEAMLKELEERMKEALEGEWKFKPHCDLPFGSTVNLLEGTYEQKGAAGPVTVQGDFKRGRLTGVTVENGVNGSISSHGVAAKGKLALLGKYDVNKKRWDGRLVASGSVGLGVTVAGEGIACYPGSAGLTLHLRKFLEAEVLHRRITERLQDIK